MQNIEEAKLEIERHRADIDSLDDQILELLNKRAEHSLAIRALKPQVKMNLYDPKREEEIFLRLEDLNEGPMYNSDIRQIYSRILKVMKEIHE